MKDKVLSAIKRFDMLREGDRVVVGLSGGADSVALLCVLKELGVSVLACHINHCLRGEESDNDERFCQNLCQKLGIPFKAVRVDVLGYCQKTGAGTEEGARQLRYNALFEADPNAKIATAHTLSDNAETVIMNLVRGSALDGLCGIPPVRGRVIRPLIDCTREDVESYLEKLGQNFVTDSSNLTDDYRRNQVRHHIIPKLKQFNSGLEQTIGRTADALREDKAFLNSLAADALNLAECSKPNDIKPAFARFKDIYPIEKRFDKSVLQKQQKPVRMRCLRQLLLELDAFVDNKKLNAMDMALSGGKTVNISDNAIFCCDEKFAYIKKTFSPYSFSGSEIPLKDTKTPIFLDIGGGFKLSICELNENEIKLFVNNRGFQFKNALDCDKICNIAVLRNRRFGESYKPVGKKYSQTFKNLFNNAALPISVRDSLAVISDDDGVIWLEGFGVSQRAAISKETKRAVLLNISGV